jgi:hypothetical protein
MTPIATASQRHRRPVEVVRSVAFPASRVQAFVAANRAALLSPKVANASEGVIPLAVRFTRRVRLQREVTVGFGPFVEEDDGSVSLTMWWEASHQPWLFPTFDGGLEIRAGESGAELRLVGSYQLPQGQAGVFADEVLGRRAARSSLESFLGQIVATISDHLAS